MTIKTENAILIILALALLSMTATFFQVVFFQASIMTAEERFNNRYESALIECMNLEARDHCLKYYGEDVYQKYYESN